MIDAALLDWVAEALEPVGTVSHRAMMGGATLYLNGSIFAILSSDGGLWFKGDATSDPAWDKAGCERFSVEMKGKIATMNYRRAPDTVYDDPDAMREWAALGIAAGLRAPKKAARKPKVGKPR